MAVVERKSIHAPNGYSLPQKFDRDMDNNKVPPSVKKTAVDLAYDIINYVTEAKTDRLKPANCSTSRTLRRTVDELCNKHEIKFKAMVKKLDITKGNAHVTIDNIANSMLEDHQFNWGRLATLYAFGALLAKQSVAEKNDVALAEQIAAYIGDYVSEHLSGFIHQNGGWAAFEDYFPEPQNTENAIWRGLLCTVVGLGAIATMVAVR